MTRDEPPAALRALLPQALPAAGAARRRSCSQQAASLLAEHSLFNGHPRFFGYITSSAAPIGVLADLLASAVNPNVGGVAALAGGDRDRGADACAGSPS